MTAKPTRKQQTRRRRRAVFILLLAAVLCGVGFYCVSVFCRATHIEVTGSTRYAAEDIIEAADIGEEQNIFTISQKALNERITALCPYIECVTLLSPFAANAASTTAAPARRSVQVRADPIRGAPRMTA